MNAFATVRKIGGVILLASGLISAPKVFAVSGLILEGQSKGDTKWIGGNLQNWAELDYIPCRVHFTGAQGNGQTITIVFPRRNGGGGGVPGFQNLTSFSASPNIQVTAGPTLSAPSNSDVWWYTVTVNVLDNNPAFLWFYARLAAGAHLNVGSSLALSGSPSSMGNLQIHKPGPGPGTPDLMILKSGPATAKPGDFVTYVLNYTNRLTGFNPATGVQVNDVLPDGVTVDTNTLPANANLVGNTIFWDLPNLPLGLGGRITFQAQIAPTFPFGSSVTNFSQILSAEDDLDYVDNTSTWITTTMSCSPPSIIVTPNSISACPGEAAGFSVTANGTAPLSFQWRKDGVPITGATATAISLAAVSQNDAGVYEVVVTNLCGSATGSGLLVVKTPVTATGLQDVTNCVSQDVSFSTSASGTGPFNYVWVKDGSLLSNTTETLNLTSVTTADSGVYSVIVSGACGSSVTNTARLTVYPNLLVAAAAADQITCPGSGASFSVTASGALLSYQWFHDGISLAGQTNSSLTILGVQEPDAGIYAVVVSGACGNPVTNTFNLGINTPLLVSSGPLSLTNCPGTPASFAATATGTGLAYQWYKDGIQLVQSTSSSLQLPAVTSSDAGDYTVIVTGICGRAVTNTANLTVNENIVIASAPQSINNCPGDDANFSVNATGTGLNYQWFRGSSPLSGQTSSSLILPSVSAADSDTYSVVVSGTCGNLVTNFADLTVYKNVVVVSAPQSITNCPGSAAAFSVTASGTALSYQWYKGSAPLSGETSSSVLLSSVSAADAGSYSVVVSGTCGNSATNLASLIVNENVMVASAPQSLTNCPGSEATFMVNASGTGLNYQWFKGGAALGSETSNSLLLPGVSAADAGTYSVVVSGTCGNSVTNTANLTVNQNVVVASAPQSITNCPGSAASFNVNASGTGLNYQWFKGSSPLPGQTSSSLVLPTVSAADAGTYSVVVGGTCGNSVTNIADLTVNQDVVVASSPLSITNCPGSAASFSVNASGTGLNYQWFKGSSPLTGQISSSLLLPDVTSSDAGTYSVVVSGTCGNSVTNLANLTVNQNVVVASAPQSITNCPGSAATFSVNASGTGLNFQWFKGSSPLPGQTSSSLLLPNVNASDADTYSVVIGGPCGNSVTNLANLTVNQNVVVASAPLSITNCPSSAATFSVNASGTGLNYQWFKGSSPLAGQTSSSLLLPNVSASDAGTYSVVVSGTCGNSVTNLANLTVNQNVVVVSAPQSITNCPGSVVSFSVNASGTGLNYQWFKGSSPLAGQTSSSLLLPSLSASDAGTYSVVVSGTCGNSVTNLASLIVNQNVVVASAPQSITNCPGSAANFSVNASGTGLNYQWFKSGSPLTGQTSSNLRLPGVSASDAGTYSVVVSGTCGNSVTNLASLTVNQDVVVASAPQSITNCPGSAATFSVSASGTGLNFQWFKGSSPLAGETSSSLLLPSVSASDAGTYSVVVSGTCGNSVTNLASLTVNQNVLVASAPQSITNCPGSAATFSVNASGTGLGYQWFKGSSPLAGQTSSSLLLSSVSASDAGTYSVVVSGTCGNSVTNVASLTVNQNVVVASAPQSITNCPGSAASFSVNASGTALNYQWFKGSSPLAGQTSSSLLLPGVSASDAGTYSVVVSGTCGNSVTNIARLTVNQNVVVVSAPLSITNCPGSAATFSVNASGTGLNYQWFKANSPLAGQTSSSLLLPSVSAADAGTYSVIVSGTCGNSVTNLASLTVNQNVLVASVPQSITNCPGSAASFSVNALGTALNYQWFKGSSPLAGQISSSLLLSSVNASDAGTYSVVVSGTCGNSVTNFASLTVNQNVLVASAPQSITNCPGSAASFSVNASGTALNYQWFKGSSPLAGQTSSNLVLPNVSASDADTYSVVVSGTCGNSVTNFASLTVNQNVVIASAPQSITNCPGSTVSFSVNASGTALNYQWFKGSSPLAGQTSSSLLVPSVSASDAGTYSVVVSGTCGNSVTNLASLAVNQNVVVASAPQSITNCPGSAANFSVNASGTALNYQWFKGSSPLAGQTSSNLRLPGVSASDAGTYSVVVSGTCGNSVTNLVNLTVNQNVVVASAPLSITNCPGSAASFSVNASGTGLNYQWFKGSSPLAGQTSSSLLLPSTSASDAGTYSVVVSGTCGNSVTNVASLTVNQNVVVASAPQSITNCPGSAATFSVNASGTGLNFQWFKGGSPLAGQTSSSLLLPSVSASDAGTYSVVVSGPCGNSVTNLASLTVNQNVVVASAPLSITNCPGSAASFSVNASGTALNYQWFKGSSPLAGQTSSSLLLSSVSASDAGTYSVVVSGTCGNSVTNLASLTVNQNVVVASAPQSITNCPGSAATFSVNASGTGLNFQWFKGSSPLAGETSSSLLLPSVSASDAGTYSVVVSGTCGNSVTNLASLTVNQNVVVASAPLSITNCPGSAATFSVNASGTSLNYQWFKGSSPLAGQTSSSLLISSVSASDAGTYSVVVSGTCGNSVTNLASLTVNQNVVVASAPLSITNCPGSAATFSVNASGTSLIYQWFKGGSPLAGQTSSSLLLPSVSAPDAGTYSVVVSGTCGNSVTNLASLTVNQNVVVASAPLSITNCPGSAATFSVNASGTALNYQWFKGSSPLAGQTSSSLLLSSVSASDAGTYSVVVSGTCGNSVTNLASLSVNQNVVVASAPLSITNCPGSAATFSVNASGTSLNYQWFKGSSPLAGQTSSSLLLSSVSASDAGTYSVVVSGTCGNSVTNLASLTVNQNVVVASAPLSITNCPGSAATFSVNASGTSLNYQWFKGSSALTGQTSSSLLLPGVSASDAGTYSVVVRGTCGNSVTNLASLTVNQNVLVASAPQSITNCPGSAASFSVNASGTGLNYQWFKGSSPLAGQTSSSLLLSSVSASDAGTYSVVVSGTCGNSVTNLASLTVNQNVLVASAPQSITNCPGSAATFSVNASGTSLNYQWFKGTSPLAGQTSSSLLLPSVSASDAGTYSVVVSGTCGNSVTNLASLTVNQNVVVASAPLSITNCPGSAASFSVNASGTSLNYQWFKGSSPLAGQTSSSLLLPGVSASDAGTYSVVVSGTCGNSVTNLASLTVNQNVVVASAPQSITNCPGSAASFSVNASGTSLNYQWFKGSSPLAGQTSSNLLLPGVSASDAGTYSVVVSGTCGNSVTNLASLTVNQNVLVASAPQSITNCPGSAASFSVNASGTALNYQWFKGSAPLAGQTSSSLLLPSVSASDAGTYSVVVSGTCGNSVTNLASLTVNQNVVVASAPQSITNCPGSAASFSVNASGTSLNYQWFKGGSPLPGQTSSSLLLPSVSASDAGTYSVVVSGTCGNSVTNLASLTVNQNVLVASAPQSITNCPGSAASFSVNASGTSLNYQWFKGSSPLAGQTSSSLLLPSVSASDAGTYSVVVSGTCGNSATNLASLTVNQNVLVASAPQSITNCPGSAASFSVNASGTGLTYQWFKGSSPLAGQTSSNLLLSSVSASDAGAYSVIVSGTCGNSVTNLASLTVNQNVVVASAPQSITNCPGSAASFSVNASGTALNYQWFKGGSPLAGQTSSSLLLLSLSAADAGTYSVVVSGTCGNSVTNLASLTVNQNVLVASAPQSITTCPGAAASFSVNASGTGLNYQWLKGSSPLAGQTSSNLLLSSVSASDAGTYSVVVSGTCGNSVTQTASLTVNEPVVVSSAPQNLTSCPGTTARFLVDASGTALNYQWYKAGLPLAGETTRTLTLTNVTAANAGLYAVAVSGICGNSITNSAVLAVNENVLVTVPPVSLTNCPNTSASFTIAASGSGLVYQWYKDGQLMPGQSATSLTLPAVTTADSAVYTVLIIGDCASATNSAQLTVTSNTTASPLSSTMRNLGETVVFSTTASGTGPFAYTWKKNGSILTGATTNSLRVSNLSYADAGVYTVEIAGACNSAMQSATLAVNHPPMVSIVTPTNGQVFIAPANFTVLADATDTDGVVTNVDFFAAGTNWLGSTTDSPYFVVRTNVATGSYTFTAVAKDDLGATGVSEPVTVTVLSTPPLTITTNIHLNLQTGLFDQAVRVFNPTGSTFDAVRVYISNLTNGAVVWNATGTNAGVPFVESHAAIPPGSYVDFVIEYYVPSRITPNPVLRAALVTPSDPSAFAAAGDMQHIDRGLMLPDHTFLIEFLSSANRTYYVQYSRDLRQWLTARSSIQGTGTRIQWIDNGEPKTESAPAVTPLRFYRVILVP